MLFSILEFPGPWLSERAYFTFSALSNCATGIGRGGLFSVREKVLKNVRVLKD